MHSSGIWGCGELCVLRPACFLVDLQHAHGATAHVHHANHPGSSTTFSLLPCSALPEQGGRTCHHCRQLTLGRRAVCQGADCKAKMQGGEAGAKVRSFSLVPHLRLKQLACVLACLRTCLLAYFSACLPASLTLPAYSPTPPTALNWMLPPHGTY